MDIRKSYHVQYIHDDDRSLRKTFSITDVGAMSALARVEQYISDNKLHLPEGVGNYSLRIRTLRKEIR